MRKFIYPGIAVISLNASENVMRALASDQPASTTTNIVEHKYTGGETYTIWRQRNPENDR